MPKEPITRHGLHIASSSSERRIKCLCGITDFRRHGAMFRSGPWPNKNPLNTSSLDGEALRMCPNLLHNDTSPVRHSYSIAQDLWAPPSLWPGPDLLEAHVAAARTGPFPLLVEGAPFLPHLDMTAFADHGPLVYRNVRYNFSTPSCGPIHGRRHPCLEGTIHIRSPFSVGLTIEYRGCSK